MTAIAPNKAVTDTRQSPNYSSGRPAGDPNVIVIHHWGVDGQSHQNVVNYLCRSGGNSSAHYVVSAGRVTQIVSGRDRAWHAGSSGNPRGIGIECRPEMSDADFETVAQLIAAIRDEWGPLPLRGHQDYMSTACPGRWYSQLSRLSARADAIRSGNASAPTTTSATTSSVSSSATQPVSADRALDARTATDGARQLVVSGVLGTPTIRRWQEVMGTPIDGVISKPSTLIRAFQAYLNSVVGAKDQTNLTGAAKLDVDGYAGPRTWKVFQFVAFNWCKAYNNGQGVGQFCDGIAGPNTIKSLQWMLNRSWAGSGKLMAKQ